MILAKWSIQREQLKAQKARDELLRDPSAWFQGHFNSDIQSDSEKINKK